MKKICELCSNDMELRPINQIYCVWEDMETIAIISEEKIWSCKKCSYAKRTNNKELGITNDARTGRRRNFFGSII